MSPETLGSDLERSIGVPDSVQKFEGTEQYPRLVEPPQTIVAAGSQGSGKGMISSRLEDREGITIYGSSKRMTLHPSYPEIKALIDGAKLVPDEKTLRIVQDFLDERAKIAAALTNGSQEQALRTLFDGVPRTLGQKKGFDELLKQAGREQPWAVKLHLDDDPKIADEIARASVRFRVRRDAALGNARSDDTNPEKVERRIRDFHEKTEPVLDQYGAEGRLLIVDAKPSFDYDTLDVYDDETFNRSAETIYARFIQALNHRND